MARAPALSSKITVGATCGYPRSLRYWQRLTDSWAALQMAWYSASVEERVTVGSSLVFQAIVVPWRRKTWKVLWRRKTWKVSPAALEYLR
eukprot:1481146-Rhodomonas_salina.1